MTLYRGYRLSIQPACKLRVSLWKNTKLSPGRAKKGMNLVEAVPTLVVLAALASLLSKFVLVKRLPHAVGLVSPFERFFP